jgi:phage FluMu protein Com
MPIRFRCAYCNQLLGIARRKAGTVVRCPTCAGQVVVPADAVAEPEESAPGGEQPVFERSDFDDLFNNPKPATEAGDPPTAGAPAPRKKGGGAGTADPPEEAPVPPEAWGTHADPDVEVEPLGIPPAGGAPHFQAPRPPGIVLSPTVATILTVVIVVGLALAFAAGLLIGRYVLPGS